LDSNLNLALFEFPFLNPYLPFVKELQIFL
jgi:hypothetical protein